MPGDDYANPPHQVYVRCALVLPLPAKFWQARGAVPEVGPMSFQLPALTVPDVLRDPDNPGSICHGPREPLVAWYEGTTRCRRRRPSVSQLRWRAGKA